MLHGINQWWWLPHSWPGCVACCSLQRASKVRLDLAVGKQHLIVKWFLVRIMQAKIMQIRIMQAKGKGLHGKGIGVESIAAW